jgi:hypothetical protein
MQEEVQERIQLQVRARFGKQSGSSDYDWLLKSDLLPPSLVTLCESLVHAAASARAFLALVTEESQRVWLLRVYDQGVDDAFRSVTGLEAAEVTAPHSLNRRQWLGLAAVSIQQSERARIGRGAALSFILPALSPQAVTPAAELINRARIGLPVSTNTSTAFHLLALPFCRQKGICLAASGRGSPPVEWTEALAPYICVSVSEARLSANEQAVLDAVTRRAPSQAEWEILDRMDTPDLHRVLLWSANSGGAPAPSGELTEQWLVAFRSDQQRGASLLKVLREDFQPHVIPPDVVRLAACDLSTDAVVLITAKARGEHVNLPVPVLEELAERGYLDDGEVIPLSRWKDHVGSSRVLAGQAIRLLAVGGIRPASAAFILNLNSGHPPDSRLFDNFGALARIAHQEGLSLPREAFVGALDVMTATQLPELDATGRIYGAWVEALADSIIRGALPRPGVLDSMEMSAAIATRRRLCGRPMALFEAFATLLKERRIEEAKELLLASKPGDSPPVSPACLRVVHSRLGAGDPAHPPAVDEISFLVNLGLARPSDIDLGQVQAREVAAYAAMWDETRPLVDLMQNRESDPPSPLPNVPERWAGAVLNTLKPSAVGRWFRAAESASRSAVGRWFANLLGISSELLPALCGEATPRVDPRELRIILPWLSDLVGETPYLSRLCGLRHMASESTLVKDDILAEELVDEVLPEADDDLRGLIIHALSGVGPLPPVRNLAPGLLAMFVETIDPINLIDNLFADANATRSSDAVLIAAIVLRVRRDGVVHPAHGYTREQRRRHAALAGALAEIQGWEPISLDEASRAGYALSFLRRLGVSPRTLVSLAEDGARHEVTETAEEAASGALFDRVTASARSRGDKRGSESRGIAIPISEECDGTKKP